MNKRICIGLLEQDEGWVQILDQIGCPYEFIDFRNDLISTYSCLVLNTLTNDNQLLMIQDYTEKGGLVIDEMGLNLYPHKEVSTVYHQFIRNESDQFSSPFIDFYEALASFKRATEWDKTLHIDSLEKGFIVFLGWPIKKLLATDSYTRKHFFDHGTTMPNEIVNKTSKGYLRKSIEDLLVRLHSLVGLPFVMKHIAPTSQASTFLFRVDTDFADQQTIIKLYELAKSHSMKLTWFLHVEAHRNWLDVFNKMEEQELALHGYEHGTSSSYHKNLENIKSADKLLAEASCSTTGFCAPYGIWSTGLGKAIDELGLKYSSEFTLNYDDLPFQPNYNGHHYKHLQIPIHPICIGSFQRKNATDEEMKSYFTSIIEQKIHLNEPVALYHHPLQDNWDVLDHIFKAVKDYDIPNLTFDEYADFWHKRSDTKFEVSIADGQMNLDVTSKNGIEHFIIHHHGHKVIVSADDVKTALFEDLEQHNSIYPQFISKKEFKKLKTLNLRDMKISFQDWMRRERL